MKQILSAIIVLFLLSACSTTRIHVFTQGLEPTELNRISEMLKEQGFRIHLVDLQPPDFANAAMIYSPANPQIDDLEKIRDLLFKIGYKDVDLIAVSKDNQSYTGRNVGLYLGELDATQKVEPPGQQMPTEFAGHCQSTDAYLKLYTNGNFDLDIISWDEFEKEHTNKLSGRWEERGGILEFFADGSTVSEFQLESFVRTDKQNLYKKTQLTSIESTPELTGCQFTSTLVSAR